MYYRGSQAAVVVYDITNQVSFFFSQIIAVLAYSNFFDLECYHGLTSGLSYKVSPQLNPQFLQDIQALEETTTRETSFLVCLGLV